MRSSVCWSSLSIIYVLAHFQQVVGILKGTKCAPHLAVHFLFSNKADCVQNTDKRKHQQNRKHI